MRFAAFIISILLLAPEFLLAQSGEVIIKDTNGFTRAQSEVTGPTKVEFEVVDDNGNRSDGIAVILTNSESGVVLTADAVNGVVAFEGVTPGVWVVSTTSQVTFTGVVVAAGATAAAGGSASAVAAIIGASAVGGGSVAIAHAVSSDDNQEPTPLSPAS